MHHSQLDDKYLILGTIPEQNDKPVALVGRERLNLALAPLPNKQLLIPFTHDDAEKLFAEAQELGASIIEHYGFAVVKIGDLPTDKRTAIYSCCALPPTLH